MGKHSERTLVNSRKPMSTVHTAITISLLRRKLQKPRVVSSLRSNKSAVTKPVQCLLMREKDSVHQHFRRRATGRHQLSKKSQMRNSACECIVTTCLNSTIKGLG